MPRHTGRPRRFTLVRHYRRKRTYSTRDRVLLYLATEGLLPEEQTQEGIAEETRCGRSTVTKELERLRSKGILLRARKRVAGHPLPKYTYRLTGAGWRAVAALRDRIASDVVSVRVPRVGTLSARMSEIPALASRRLDVAAAASLVREGRLDLTRLPSTSASNRSSRIWGGGLRQVDRLFGREHELEVLNRWFHSESRILLVTGLPGIGKSALVATWVRLHHPAAPIFGFELRRSTSVAGFLSDLAAFLAALGKPSLASHLAQGVPLDFGFLRRLLDRELKDLPLLVVLDNIDQAPRDVAKLVRQPIVDLLHRRRVRLVLVARRSPRWLVTVRRSVPSLELMQVSGLTPGASEALLRYRGLDANRAFVQDVVRTTRGHPLLLHLTVSGSATRTSAVRRYLEEEVWATLTDDERTTLETASVFRRAVPERVLEAASHVDRRVIDSLTERNLLDRTFAEGYLVHDLVREFVQAQMDAARVQALHTSAAASLLGDPDPTNRWEGVYHLLGAGKIEAVATYLDSEGAPLLDSIAAALITSLVRTMPYESNDAASSCVFSEVLGDSLRIQGHIGPALQQYMYAKSLAIAHGREGRIPRLLRKMAFLERCRNRYSRALGYLTEAQARLSREPNPGELTEVLREMALVEQALGDLPNASQHLNAAVDLATEAGDRAALSRALVTLGNLESTRGNREQGLEANLEALRIAEQSGNLTEIARAHVIVGTSLTSMGKVAESLPYYEKGSEVARLLGNVRLTAYATLNRANALLELGRYEEAGGPLQEATAYFEILEERDTLAFLKTYEGEREMGLGHWFRATEAWKVGISALRQHGSPGDLALVLRKVAGFYAERGDAANCRAHLAEARELAKKLGNARLQAEIDGDLERLQNAPATPSLP